MLSVLRNIRDDKIRRSGGLGSTHSYFALLQVFALGGALNESGAPQQATGLTQSREDFRSRNLAMS